MCDVQCWQHVYATAIEPRHKKGSETLTGGKISANLLNHKTLATFF